MKYPFRRAVAAALVCGGVYPLLATAQDAKKPADPPKDVRVGPPAELAELRAAVEAAAKKGENVDDIRAKLEALEKALTGKTWARPKVVADEPAAPPAAARPNPGRRPGFELPQGGPNLLPLGGLGGLAPLDLGGNNPFGGLGLAQPDDELMGKAQALLLKAARLAAEDPPNEKQAAALEKEAQELLMQALMARGGGRGGLQGLQGLNGMLGGGLPAGQKPRLGVQVKGADDGPGVVVVEVVAGSVAEKLGLKEDDVIVEFAGKEVPADSAAFVRMVQGAKGGAKLDLAYIRDGKKTVKAVELAK